MACMEDKVILGMFKKSKGYTLCYGMVGDIS